MSVSPTNTIPKSASQLHAQSYGTFAVAAASKRGGDHAQNTRADIYSFAHSKEDETRNPPYTLNLVRLTNTRRPRYHSVQEYYAFFERWRDRELELKTDSGSLMPVKMFVWHVYHQFGDVADEVAKAELETFEINRALLKRWCTNGGLFSMLRGDGSHKEITYVLYIECGITGMIVCWWWRSVATVVWSWIWSPSNEPENWLSANMCSTPPNYRRTRIAMQYAPIMPQHQSSRFCIQSEQSSRSKTKILRIASARATSSPGVNRARGSSPSTSSIPPSPDPWAGVNELIAFVYLRYSELVRAEWLDAIVCHPLHEQPHPSSDLFILCTYVHNECTHVRRTKRRKKTEWYGIYCTPQL